MWSNSFDLSLDPKNHAQSSNFQSKLENSNIQSFISRMEQNLLADDTSSLLKTLLNYQSKIINQKNDENKQKEIRIDFILDNAGLEFLSDLIFMHYLIELKFVNQIYVHLKYHPTFVSDTTFADVNQTLYWLINQEDEKGALLKEFGLKIIENLEKKQIILENNLFWTSPRLFCEMPKSLHSHLSNSNLLIIKGDANYRRLVGDVQWDWSTPFSDVVDYFEIPLLVIRTQKAEVSAGLSPKKYLDAQSSDPKWLTNGNWGVIHFFQTTE